MCFKWCSSVRLRQGPVLNHICLVLSCLMTMIALEHYDYESDCQMCCLVLALKENFYCQMCFLVQALKENVNKINNAVKRILG